MDRIDAYRLLARVAELGSFTRAAKETGLTQPRVSRIIRDLEKDLSAQLLVRSTRKVSLTPEGTRFLSLATEAMDRLSDAEDEVRASSASPKGKLRVTAPVGFGQRFVAPMVLSYLQNYSGARASLHLTDDFVNLVEGAIDVAVRIGKVTQEDLRIVRLGSCPMRLVATHDFLRTYSLNSPDALTSTRTLAYASWRKPAQWVLEVTGAARKQLAVRVSPIFESSNLFVLRDAVLQGHGVANLPAWLVADDLQNEKLVTVLKDWSPAAQDIHAVLPPGHLTPRRARVFIDMLRAGLESDAELNSSAS